MDKDGFQALLADIAVYAAEWREGDPRRPHNPAGDYDAQVARFELGDLEAVPVEAAIRELIDHANRRQLPSGRQRRRAQSFGLRA